MIPSTRYTTRWTHAESDRIERVAALAQHPITLSTVKHEFDKECQNGKPLPAAMRRVRNLVVCALIHRDLSGQASLDEVLATMTMLGDFVVQTHLSALMEEEVAIFGRPVDAARQPQEMIVLGMGKLGGEELNLSSDIDVIFIYPEAGQTQVNSNHRQPSLSNHEFFTCLGKKLIAAISHITEDGFSFRVDTALRPHGHSGSLVNNFNGIERYLTTQGRPWERYAWCKARPITGLPQEQVRLTKIIHAFVFSNQLNFNVIDDMRVMHMQIRQEVQRLECQYPERSDNVKLGRGGIREIEFLTQVFQLMRGGRDPDLCHQSTRVTLRVLKKKGWLDVRTIDELSGAYNFLRRLEHRLQSLDDAQTHTLPTREADRLFIAQTMGFSDIPTFMAQLQQQRMCVAAHFNNMFNVASFDSGLSRHPANHCQRLSETDDLTTFHATLTTWGFSAPAIGAQRLARMWTSSLFRHLAAQDRQRLITLINAVLPILTQEVDKATHLPTLDRLLNFFDAIAQQEIGGSFLALLTEYPPTLHRALRMMRASAWAAQYLTQHPILLDELLDTQKLTAPPNWELFIRNCRQQLSTVTRDTTRQMDILRERHHAQQFHLLAQDLEGMLSVEMLADHLSALADCMIALVLETIWASLPNRHRDTPAFAVIAYGKLGGKELGYSSDLDLVFLYDDDDCNAPMLYTQLAQRFMTWMTLHTSAGSLFDVDLALRPDGASGLLVTSFGTFERYQYTSAWPWEHQALTRARYCAGDQILGQRFETLRKNVLCQTRDPHALRQTIFDMRHKMRMSAKRKENANIFNLKHSVGGMIDIEFMVQYLILRHATHIPALIADIGNIALLKLCGQQHLIMLEEANACADIYREYRKLQHQCRLQGDERGCIPRQAINGWPEIVKRLWDKVITDTDNPPSSSQA